MTDFLTDDLWILIHDALGSPEALTVACKRFYRLMSLRFIRCRLDGPMAVHRILTMRPRVRHLTVHGINDTGTGFQCVSGGCNTVQSDATTCAVAVSPCPDQGE